MLLASSVDVMIANHLAAKGWLMISPLFVTMIGHALWLDLVTLSRIWYWLAHDTAFRSNVSSCRTSGY